MKLFIDTTQIKKAVITLENGKKVTKEGESPLPLIEEVLKENGSKLPDLKEIDVNPGPGSFTGIKIGVAITNALNFALGRESSKVPKYE